MNCTKTPDEVRQHLRAQGKSVAQWARENGFSAIQVYRALEGVTKGNYGAAHEIAVRLGLKAQPRVAA
jgi:gp16 family phage-associated protein